MTCQLLAKIARRYALGSVCLLLANTVGAASIQLGALKDTTLYAENGDRSNGAGPALFVGNNGQGFERRGLISFDLSALPANATINSVSLQLFATSTGDNGAGTQVTLHSLNADWGQGLSSSGGDSGGGGNGAPATANDATWTDNFYGVTNWTTAGGDFSAPASASVSAQLGVNTWSSVQMKNDVQAWVNGGLANYGWLLLGDTGSASTAFRFGTLENGISGYQPQLTVDYTFAVPLPAALWLFASGLLGLAAVRRR